MNTQIGERAFILAAGLGKRMRPLTNDRPKPLIKVGGKALIDYAADALVQAQVTQAVVNAHYLADQIDAWAGTITGLALTVSDERAALLETGGGIVKALPLLGRAPFFVMNGDGFWIEGKTPALTRLKQAWDDAAMDCLLLLSPLERTRGLEGKGDFHMDGAHRLSRRNDPGRQAFAYIGAFLVHPRLFASAPTGAFSMNLLWDKAIVQGRLFGLVHDDLWLHVGTPDAVAMAETILATRS
jgi:N-acetyl-alpha-D-muramate 1-phosphate uridylyltransferase